MRRATARRFGVWAIAFVLAATGGVMVASSGEAAPRKDLQQVQAQVRDLQMQAGAAHEEATRAADRLDAVQGQLDSVQGRMQRERDDLRSSQSTVADLARSMYANGGIDPTLQILLAENPEQFLNQAAVMGLLVQSQLDQIRQAQTARLRLAQTEAEVTDKEAAARQLRDEMSAAEGKVSERLDAANQVLAGLQEEERKRLAQLESERRQQQVQEARQTAAEARQQDQGAAPGGSGSDGAASGGGSGGGSRAQAAVQYALSQVGEPYSYSANPPDSWDCSKLTSAAWATAGVGLTPLSYTQWDQTRRVPVSEIQPGDLVFYFGSGAHHVAIYVGNGKMVSASNPNDGVEIIDFLGPWYGERFSGVGRVVS
jgi:cell wall-associated NlpC family hydrolase